MAISTNYVAQTAASEQILSLYKDLQASRIAQAAAAIGTVGTVPAATTSPPVSTTDDGITLIKFPHVRPGDLITADFVNALIDVVLGIDVRLQRIEALAANALERDKAKVAPAASQEFVGKP